ncbi:hypothetical protein M2459_003198 [Parabacteroides sp. PF5-5]|nr:hypothetical protein [Parabacteroides sp. PH5-39]MDH6317374.1 hypothetical protein [Parabacteroides sp. PF5-13]MDH6321185.1 hypothetical protein [Parabacteroides sp. PH5-13]MDH6324917.1 hypothetical protein [Parabacteroides sp. PH5-8]MDH6328559.1 hypothetical protein [Parabacteroides sp. PH5-41]MDH6336428.1 hypothetical protein [Parabacteroides sp. PF5-5]MDH6347492.1 hypothetical protein [Parabacteroides sp. PH5-46]MDH6362387.1 hypothetical protein [Parabacteroides sp. PH5-16]MDH6378122.
MEHAARSTGSYTPPASLLRGEGVLRSACSVLQFVLQIVKVLRDV